MTGDSIYKQNKILFLPSIGSKKGVGNFFRCLSIARHIGEAAQSIFCYEPHPFFKKILDREKIDSIRFDDILKELNTVAVIFVDRQGPIEDTELYRLLRENARGARIVSLDYFYRDRLEIDVMINLVDYHLSDWPDEQPHCEYYEGFEYAVIRPMFFKYRNASGEDNKLMRHVLITFGGDDQSEWTFKSVQWLEKYIKPALDIKIIIGPFNNQRKMIADFLETSRGHTYTFLEYVENIAEYMVNADIVFCGGGTTIMESAFLGKPAIALPQHDTEKIFLSYFERYEYLVSGVDRSFSDLVPGPAVRLFSDSSLIRRVSKRGKQLIDGGGLSRIADIVLLR